jgi:hypothetical protein
MLVEQMRAAALEPNTCDDRAQLPSEE